MDSRVRGCLDAAAGAVATLGTIALAIATWRTPRREALPWTALAFVGWAGASVTWSRWAETTVLTWALLAATTLVGMLLAAMLTWRHLLRALSVALGAVMATSVVFELWAALVVGGPVGFGLAPTDPNADRSAIWTNAQLLTGGRIDGIVGNANLLSMLALLAVVVGGIQLAVGGSRRTARVTSLALAVFLLVRTSSATAFVATVVLAGAIGLILVTRAVRTTRGRTIVYLAASVTAVAGLATSWMLRRSLLAFVGRDSDLTDRTEIWDLVLARGAASPVVGGGFATPWAPWDPAFSDWIVLPQGLHIIQAHSVWVDVAFQLGVVGVALLAAVYALFIWRTWVFAAHRRLWDTRTDTLTATVSLLPVALGVIVLIQGLTESSPLLLWGWMLTVLFSAKMQPWSTEPPTGSAADGEVGYGVGLDQPRLV